MFHQPFEQLFVSTLSIKKKLARLQGAGRLMRKPMSSSGGMQRTRHLPRGKDSSLALFMAAYTSKVTGISKKTANF